MATVSSNAQGLGNQMNTNTNVFFLSQRFYFECAHTLSRSYEVEGSLRIHGHTYEAEIALYGSPDKDSGMVVDLALLKKEIERIRYMLDHRFLDEVEGLGPPTLENLALFIKNEVTKNFGNLASILVERRVSGDKCILKTQ
jgi:6-pyruvoyltetrahydropterin/6-carboxytetrahydropterin synthase